MASSSRLSDDAAEYLKQRIILLLEENTDGLSKEEVIRLTPTSKEMQVDAKIRAGAINSLLSENIVEMQRGANKGSFILKLKKGTQLENATQEEQSVFTLIEEAGKQAIWIRSLRDKTGLSEIQLKKALKSLETKKLVKSLKAVSTARKCYILYNLEADKSLSGGTFYDNQQLDSQFVQTLSEFCVRMLQAQRERSEETMKEDPLAQRDASYVTSEEIAKYIHSKGFVNVPLEVEDVEKVLNVCVLDGRLERRATNNSSYRARKVKSVASALTTIPCLYCPVRKDCAPGNEVSPETCEYYRKHFDL